MVKLKKLFSIKRHTAATAAEDSDDQSRPLSQVHSDEAQRDSLGESAQGPTQEWGDWSGHSSSGEGSRNREAAGKKKTFPFRNLEKMKMQPLSAFALAPRRNNDDDSITSFASMQPAQERRYFGAVQSASSHSSISDFRSADTAASDTEVELGRSKKRKSKKKSKKLHKTSSKKKKSKKDAASATSSTADASEDLKDLTEKLSSPGKRKAARRMSSKVDQILEEGMRSPKGDDVSLGGDSRTVSSRTSSVRRKNKKKKSKKAPSRSNSVASSRSSRPPTGKKVIRHKSKIKYQKRDDQSAVSEVTDASPFKADVCSPSIASPNKKGGKKKKSNGVDAEGLSENVDTTSIPKQIDTGDSSDEKKKKVALHKERSAADPLDTLTSPPNRKRSTVKGKGDGQREEVLKLQHQLSEALQKIVTSTEEHIADKSQFLKVSKELSQMKTSTEEMIRERDDLQDKLNERDEVVETSMQRIDNLEQAIERQIDQQEELEAKLERSDDEIEKLLIEMQDLESTVEGKGIALDTEGLRADLKDKKKELIDKQRTIDDQISKIASLQQEVENADVANKLQIEELQADKRALQGKLRGEKLDAGIKSEKCDAAIGDLQKQLAKYQGDSEAQDAADVREKLLAVQAALEASVAEVELVSSSYQQAKDEKDDLLEKNNVLTEQIQVLERNVKEQSEKSADLENKVLQWTEKTYSWKTKAENAERKAGTMGDQSEDGSENGEVVNEAPQGLFLQSVMDKQEVKKTKKIWGVFSRNNNAQEGDEHLAPEEIRIRELEKRNGSLEDTITELKSDIEQLETDHKDEMFSLKDQISTLDDDNEALKRKNETLVAICETKSGE